MKKNNPLVSIIIVNWNGKDYLEKCISSLSKILYKETEIIVVDQNSSDGSQEMIKQRFEKVRMFVNPENTGYVGGNNFGANKAKGKYLLILNNDIEVDKNFMEPLVEAMEKNRKLGCVQPKAINLRWKGKLDGGGSFFTYTGFLNHFGYLEKASDKRFSQRYPVYSVKGAYMMTRRDLFNKVGGFDKDFFIYFEESDYCGRLWVSGYRVEFIPNSLVYHWGGADTQGDWAKKFALIQYRSFRNRISSYIKNLSLSKMIIVLPIHVLICEFLSIYYLFSGKFNVSFSIQKAIFWNIKNFDKNLKKRRFIQSKLRGSSDKEIFKEVEKNVSPLYYLRILKLLTK